jgi:phosphohistidine swiveling domain-containing protein
MTLTTYLVDISSIAFTQETVYSPILIEELAKLLLIQKGTTQPLIVKKIGIDKYELISGEIVLLAAIKAYEIDDYFETIRVIIQEDQDLTQEAVLIEIIKSHNNLSTGIDLDETHTQYLLDINNISFTQEKAYNPELIEELAKLLLIQKGTTRPIIVKKTGLNEYELVSGEIVLLAAIKAHEIDNYFEMIRVVIQEEQDLTQETILIAEIESTEQNIDPEYEKITAQAIDTKEKHITTETIIKTTKITKKTPIKDGKWLMIGNEIVSYGDFSELNKINDQLHNENPKINTNIVTASELSELILDKEWYLAKLAKIEQEIEAHKKFLT